MIQRAAFLALALTLFTACGSQDGTGAGGGAAGTTGGSGGSGAGTTHGSGGGGGDDGNTVTLTMDSFDVPPGGEVYRCQNFANSLPAMAEVGAFESHMTEGSHHLLLFYRDGATNGPLEDCSGLEFAATPYGTQRPDDELAFPAGVAAQIPKTSGFRVQSHYLNTTHDTIHAEVKVTFHLVDPATVKHHAGILFVLQPHILIPPHATQKVSYDCALPQDMQIMKAWSHMHRHGIDFTSSLGGKTLYDTTDWSEPTPVTFDPARAAKAGDPLHFECTFQNDEAGYLTFGESAQTDEMCILTAPFYPVPDGVTTISCGQ